MKPFFMITNALLLVCIAYIGVQFFYKQIVNYPRENNISGIKKVKFYPIHDPAKEPLKGDYKKIESRNLFNVDTGTKKTTEPSDRSTIQNTTHLKLIELDLILWGTVIGTTVSYAVIEDKEYKIQSLYRTGDVIKGATIQKILRDSVILRHNNQDYILRSNLLQTPTNQQTSKITKNNRTGTQTIPVKKSTIRSSLGNIDQLKRQISIRPILNNGISEGLLVYRIRPKSFFHNLGLRNGDVIKQVNGKPVTSADDAIKIYQELQKTDQFKVMVMRKGTKQEIAYRVTPDEGSN